MTTIKDADTAISADISAPPPPSPPPPPRSAPRYLSAVVYGYGARRFTPVFTAIHNKCPKYDFSTEKSTASHTIKFITLNPDATSEIEWNLDKIRFILRWAG